MKRPKATKRSVDEITVCSAETISTSHSINKQAAAASSLKSAKCDNYAVYWHKSRRAGNETPNVVFDSEFHYRPSALVSMQPKEAWPKSFGQGELCGFGTLALMWCKHPNQSQ